MAKDVPCGFFFSIFWNLKRKKGIEKTSSRFICFMTIFFSPGLVSDAEKESPLISLKRSNATPVKPHEGNTFLHGQPFFCLGMNNILLRRVCQAAPSQPSVWFCWAEISSRTDVKVEGDKRLDKLESFLDKLHNKGTTSSQLLHTCLLLRNYLITRIRFNIRAD